MSRFSTNRKSNNVILQKLCLTNNFVTRQALYILTVSADVQTIAQDERQHHTEFLAILDTNGNVLNILTTDPVLQQSH